MKQLDLFNYIYDFQKKLKIIYLLFLNYFLRKAETDKNSYFITRGQKTQEGKKKRFSSRRSLSLISDSVHHHLGLSEISPPAKSHRFKLAGIRLISHWYRRNILI